MSGRFSEIPEMSKTENPEMSPGTSNPEFGFSGFTDCSGVYTRRNFGVFSEDSHSGFPIPENVRTVSRDGNFPEFPNQGFFQFSWFHGCSDL
jgi:hypothetical protein